MITVAQELRYPQSYGQIQSQVGSGTGGVAGNAISAAGVTITAGTPQEFTAFMTEQREKIRKIIEIGGLRGK